MKKGYVMSLVPRNPTQTERLESKNLKISNKGHYLSKGLYCGHNVAFVTARVVNNAQGEKERIVKLRNPWINEFWKGDWSHESQKWTREVREQLNYVPEVNGHFEYWMSLQDLMNYYERLNIYKTIPGNTYNSINISGDTSRFLRTIIRVTVPEKGKYTFAVDQPEQRLFEDKNIRYCPVKVTLGKLAEDRFMLLSHTKRASTTS
jgi:calpain-15